LGKQTGSVDEEVVKKGAWGAVRLGEMVLLGYVLGSPNGLMKEHEGKICHSTSNSVGESAQGTAMALGQQTTTQN